MNTLQLQDALSRWTDLAGTDMAAAMAPLLEDPELILKLLALLPAQADQRNLSLIALILAKTFGTHGDDDRIPIADLVGSFPIHAAARTAARGVALLTSADAVSFHGSDARLKAGEDELQGPFKDEPCIPVTHPATAFLITRKHVVTAAHAVAFRDPRSLYLAFGFGTRSTLATDRSFYTLAKSQLVRVKQIVTLVFDARLGDIAVLELAEQVAPTVAMPLTLAPARSTKMLQEVAMLSHARAQPLKAVVRSPVSPQPWRYPRVLDQNERFLYTNLDSFQGCSGSPLVDTRGRVIGVQFRGEDEKDVYNNPVSYPEDAAGSWATRIDVIRDTLAALGTPLPMA